MTKFVRTVLEPFFERTAVARPLLQIVIGLLVALEIV
jgi:hypothetical protein